MKAYERYQQDMAGGSELHRAHTDRQEYYQQLRQTMREECLSENGCRLLENFSQRREAGQLERLYLLDAAAIWECYEVVIDGHRNLRDLGLGLPYPVEGRILPWDEVQRLADEGALPVAVVDEETGKRLAALLRCCTSGGILRDAADVDPRAHIVTQAPDPDPDPAQDPSYLVPSHESMLAAENDALQRLVMNKSLQVSELTDQVGDLKREVEELRSKLAQLRQHQDSARDYAALAARSILEGHTAEAQTAAARLNTQLQQAFRELERAVAERQKAEATLARTQEQLASDRAQLQALRQQERTARQSIASACTARKQAQKDAAQAVQDQDAAQAELEAASARLAAATQALRELRRKIAETNRAADLTQRQADALQQ